MLSEDELNGVPLLVFCNKQDVAGALKPEAVSEALGLAGSERNREWSVRGSCATKGEGLEEGLDWLVLWLLGCMRTVYLKLVVQAYQRHTEEIARISVRVVFLWSHCIISTFHNHCIASSSHTRNGNRKEEHYTSALLSLCPRPVPLGLLGLGLAAAVCLNVRAPHPDRTIVRAGCESAVGPVRSADLANMPL
jgi:hypothetical protein